MEIVSATTASSILLWLFLLFTYTSAKVHYHEFVVEATPVKRLCKTTNVITVNGQFPGPTLEVNNGDSLVIKAVNKAKYNLTLHWHGVRQLRNGWADGPEFVTQCPIRPGMSYTYRFTIQNQEGTLWWHAHNSWLRATVHGAIVIYPKEGTTYPFPKPHREFPVVIGEWWNRDPMQVIRQALKTGGPPNTSDAYTFNGQPGDFLPCSSKETTILPVGAGETNLLRFVNAAMENEHFIAIAGHTMTVVNIDAAYTKPYTTPYLMLAPGQTTDVLVTTNQPPGRYYLAARVYESARGVPFDNTTATAILEYKSGAACGSGGPPPMLPLLPAFNDTPAKTAFVAGLRSPGPVDLPGPVDEHLFFTVGLGLFNCPRSKPCAGPNGTRFGASMNNISFTQPRTVSMLQAQYFRIPGVYTADFPPVPPILFDFTANNISRSLQQPVRGTKAYKLRFGSVVQVVMQDTNIFAGEEHPMHIHGYQFYVLATGFGNYDPVRDPAKFNLVDPPMRNTVGVPVSGWAVIRFKADNPGIWFVHCHIDSHLVWGLAMAFEVENGVGLLESVLPPPLDLPIC